MDDTILVDGLVLNQPTPAPPEAPKRIEKAKIGIIQFQISPPKTDVRQTQILIDISTACVHHWVQMEMNVVVTDYQQMDRVLKEERAYLLNIVKQIKKAGCNVLLIQKSILRLAKYHVCCMSAIIIVASLYSDAISDMGIHFLAKLKIMVVKDVEREDVEFYSKTLGCRPIASLDHFLPTALGSADLAEESTIPGSGKKVVKITGIQNKGKTVTVLVRGSNKLVLDEAERSLHDSLCVVRCLVKKRFLISGGGAPEIELARALRSYSASLVGAQQMCIRGFADALEVIPITLAENGGLSPIETVTELRNRHEKGEQHAGINVKKASASPPFYWNDIKYIV